MAVPLSVLLILTGITEIYSITTVSQVSVQAGAPVTIPCLYGSRYRDNVKYLCQGFYFVSCSDAIKTNQPQGSGNFLISDDKEKNIFTVTIKQVTNENTHYWCAVEIDNGKDIRAYFQLSVTTGTSSLYVDRQEVTGVEGGNVTINCNNCNPGKIKWCMLGGQCVMEPSGTIGETTVSFNTSVTTAVSVTMSGLKLQTSGWYWFLQGDIQLPVHLSVSEKVTTTPLPADGDEAVTAIKQEQTRTSIGLMTLIIPLSLLVSTVIVASFIWLILRCKQANRKSAASQLESCTESDGDVTYSAVVTVKKQSMKRSEAKEEDVTYSTVAQCQSNV